MRNPWIIAVASALLLCSSPVEAAVFPVDTVGGLFPPLQLLGGSPVISYRDRIRGDLKLRPARPAAQPRRHVVITTVDSMGTWGDIRRCS